MEGPLEQVLEHPKSPDFIDANTSGFAYDSLAGLDYLQYPHTEAFGIPSIHRTSSSSLYYICLRRSFHSISFPSLGIPHFEPCCSHGRVHLWQSLVHDQLSRSSLHSTAQCLSRCLDVLERRRDVLGQYFWSHQPRLWLSLAQPCFRSSLRALQSHQCALHGTLGP